MFLKTEHVHWKNRAEVFERSKSLGSLDNPFELHFCQQMPVSKKIFLIVAFVAFYYACSKDQTVQTDSGYPPEIAGIILPNCATTGCHTDEDKIAAAGLSLETWDDLFAGANNGAAIIPFRVDQSLLAFYINIYEELGLMLSPTMPQNEPALNRSEIETMMNWINSGAPNDKSEIPFCCDDNRSKYYVVNRGCDMITVFDQQTDLAMRCIDVGQYPDFPEAPYAIEISHDGNFWYMIFIDGDVIQKYSTATDSLIDQRFIGVGNWSDLIISPDGTKAFIVNWTQVGQLVYFDLENMEVLEVFNSPGMFVSPHGIIASEDFTTLYMTSETGNYFYIINVTDPFDPQITKKRLDPLIPAVNDLTMRPQQIIFSPDFSKYYISCSESNEIRVFHSSNDSLIAVIPTGIHPTMMSISETYPYLFVACDQTVCSLPKCKGSVEVINYETDQHIKTIQGELFEPHGIAVNDVSGKVYITNRNISVDGPAPHHQSLCEGKNGFVSAFDLNTLEMIDFDPEVSVDPFQILIRNP